MLTHYIIIKLSLNSNDDSNIIPVLKKKKKINVIKCLHRVPLIFYIYRIHTMTYFVCKCLKQTSKCALYPDVYTVFTGFIMSTYVLLLKSIAILFLNTSCIWFVYNKTTSAHYTGVNNITIL